MAQARIKLNGQTIDQFHKQRKQMDQSLKRKHMENTSKPLRQEQKVVSGDELKRTFM